MVGQAAHSLTSALGSVLRHMAMAGPYSQDRVVRPLPSPRHTASGLLMPQVTHIPQNKKLRLFCPLHLLALSSAPARAGSTRCTCLKHQQVQCVVLQVGGGGDLVRGDTQDELLVVAPGEQQAAGR